MRAYLFLIVAIGVFGSLFGRALSPSPPHERQIIAPAAVEDSSSSQAESRLSQSTNPMDGTVELQRNSDGHFYADVQINGATVHMLIDTGASAIALTRDDARSAGLATSIGMNEVVGEGADGAVHGEYVRLDRVELGQKRSEGLAAVILNSGQQSLLGQSFLGQFSSVQIEGDRMLLR
jgi:aspartyl protease family protein